MLTEAAVMVMNDKQLIMMADTDGLPHGNIEVECEDVYSTCYQDGYCVLYVIYKNSQKQLVYSKNYQGDRNDYSPWFKYKYEVTSRLVNLHTAP